VTENTNLKVSQLFIEFLFISLHNLKCLGHRKSNPDKGYRLVLNFFMYKNLISSFTLSFVILCLANVEAGDVFGIFILV
jgi:hypothetical protein